MSKYKLLDCGDQKKVELFGDYKLIRPCPQALWKPFNSSLWNSPDAEFVRGSGENGKWAGKIPAKWEVESDNGLRWVITPNDFGNLGVFTEHWVYAPSLEDFFDINEKVLDLFSYSGSNIMNLIKKGYKITAVDSSKNAMDTYTGNMDINKLSRDGQRLILEDAYKFVAREERRGAKYGSLVVDAPSFGRGTKGEVFNIEESFVRILETCKELVNENGKIVVTLHSPRFTPVSLRVLCSQLFTGKKVIVDEIINMCESGAELPSGFLMKIS
jgi:23S rRNA (cytosine1962-C5)-methyltransferase